jgi:hypothetical protein
MAPPIVLSLLLASQTPDYDKSVAALEEAYRASPVPEILLSLAATYEQWPNHCREEIASYQRFFTACGQCGELKQGLQRFDRALDRCVTTAEEEAALREQLVLPIVGLRLRHPGDARRSEVVDLLRRGRSIDRTKTSQSFVTVIELGVDAEVDRLNALREDAWAVLLKADADTEQVLAIAARIKELEPGVHRLLLNQLIEADRRSDQEALNTIRVQAIEILRNNSSTAPPLPPPDSCTANPLGELGYLTVDSTPWSEIYVNGVRVGSTPVARLKVPAGCAVVRAVNPETGKEVLQSVRVRPNRVSIHKLKLGE